MEPPERPEPPVAAGELETLAGFLEHHRATLAWKTSGLDAEQLRARPTPSAMSLGGLLKHMALVEEYWFVHRLRDERWSPIWAAVDWDADPDWEWHSADGDTPEELRGLWEAAVARARDAVEASLDDTGLDLPAAVAWPDGRAPSLRWIFVHMVEEYARHNGHADLIREAVDGLTGE